MAQVFTNGAGYDHFYLMTKMSNTKFALTSIIQDAGISFVLVSNNSPEEVHGYFCDTC